MQAKGNKGSGQRPKQSGSCTGAAGWNECKIELLQVSQSWKANVQALKGGVDAAMVRSNMSAFMDAAPGSIFTAQMKKGMMAFHAEVGFVHQSVLDSASRAGSLRVLPV